MKNLLKNNLFIYAVAVTTVSTLIIVVMLMVAMHYAEKAESAYASGQLDMRMEVETKINEAVDIIESISLPSKGSEFYKAEFNPKGEAHSAIIVGDGLKEFVYNNCDENTLKNFDEIVAYSNSKGIAPEMTFAISWADTMCGRALTTPNNYGNVGNNDRGHRVGYFTPLEGWKALIDVLNNKYLGKNTKVGQLSGGGRVELGSTYDCPNAIMGYKCYATSMYNWNKNVKRALSVMLGRDITAEWEYRR